MTMTEWSHGYDVSVGYTYGFYHEMAPSWLDLCARLAGYVPPARGERGHFRYLELGTGQGLGLCLLAAANPQAEFVGVDFHPAHIAHARELAATAALTNIRFVEADFADLAASWPSDLGTFDYVTLHGIYSWVRPALRLAVVSCLASATGPGALVYNSYNSQPGWLGSIPFQHVARRIKETSGKSGMNAVTEAIQLMDRLSAADATVFKTMPSLRSRLETVKKQKPAYLIQEYLNDAWNPLWHSEVARELAVAKLDYLGSANIAETLLPGVLPAGMRQLIAEQADAATRQDLQDLIINQAFRRDLFCRGARRLLPRAAAAEIRLRLISRPRDGTQISIKTAYGGVTADAAVVTGIADALGDGVRSVEEISTSPALRGHGATLLRNLVVMLQRGFVGVAADGEAESCHRLNAALACAAARGAPYRHLAVAALGSGLPAKDFDLLLIDAWLAEPAGCGTAELSAAVRQRIARSGQELHHEGSPLSNAETERRVASAVEQFLSVDLPRWQRLGALP